MRGNYETQLKQWRRRKGFLIGLKVDPRKEGKGIVKWGIERMAGFVWTLLKAVPAPEPVPVHSVSYLCYSHSIIIHPGVQICADKFKVDLGL